MLPLEAVLEGAQAGAPPPLLPLDQGIPGWSGVSLSPACVQRVRQGQAIGRADLLGGCATAGGATAGGATATGTAVKLLDDAGRLIGLGEVDGFGGIRPRRIFNL